MAKTQRENNKLDEFKFVCKTLINYGVTDADFKKQFFSHITNNTYVKSMVSCAYSQFLPEAYDLASYIDASDFAPYKSFWDRLFRREKMNDELKAILNRILEVYI